METVTRSLASNVPLTRGKAAGPPPARKLCHSVWNPSGTPGVTASEERRIAVAASIEEHLCRLNSEFGSYVPKERRTPSIALTATGDPAYFPPGVKHRYTRA